MVTISNGVKSFKVPSGSVKAYEPAGYHVVGKEEEQAVDTPVTGQQKPDNEEIDFDGEENTDGEGGEDKEPDADEKFVTELMEKSLSQWTADETKKFVSIKGIDTTGAKKLGDVKNIIKKYLDDEAKKGNN